MSECKTNQLAKDIAVETVHEVMREMGINPEHFDEHQRDFAYLRQQRKTAEKISMVVRLTVITTIISGGLAVLWIGIKHAVSGGTN